MTNPNRIRRVIALLERAGRAVEAGRFETIRIAILADPWESSAGISASAQRLAEEMSITSSPEA
jgi:hypothetical protein